MAQKLGVVLLILLLLLLVIPLGIGMVMAPCPECEIGAPVSAFAACVAVFLASALIASPLVARRYRFGLGGPNALLLIRDLDPPPRPA